MNVTDAGRVALERQRLQVEHQLRVVAVDGRRAARRFHRRPAVESFSFSAFWMRRSTSRTASRYSLTLARSPLPDAPLQSGRRRSSRESSRLRFSWMRAQPLGRRRCSPGRRTAARTLRAGSSPPAAASSACCRRASSGSRSWRFRSRRPAPATRGRARATAACCPGRFCWAMS